MNDIGGHGTIVLNVIPRECQIDYFTLVLSHYPFLLPIISVNDFVTCVHLLVYNVFRTKECNDSDEYFARQVARCGERAFTRLEAESSC